MKKRQSTYQQTHLQTSIMEKYQKEQYYEFNQFGKYWTAEDLQRGITNPAKAKLPGGVLYLLLLYQVRHLQGPCKNQDFIGRKA